MRHAISYQHCVAPDDDDYERDVRAIAEWIHDGDTADDVKIDARRIAYNVNKRHPWCVSEATVRELAEAAVHFHDTDEIT